MSSKANIALSVQPDPHRTQVQADVNRLFSGYPKQDHHKEFREFRDDTNSEVKALLHKFEEAGKSGVLPVIKLAEESITKDGLNPNLVKKALGIFLTHNSQAQAVGVVAPPLKTHSGFVSKVPMSNPVTADTLKGVEILSYFREDYDFNEHHYHWHLVYPTAGILKNGKFQRTIDRQGELFLYMHSQMIARYNAELLGWGLDITHAWSYDDILTFGYDPVPTIRNDFGARPPFQGWYETHNPHLDGIGITASKADMKKWKCNILRAIKDGYFVTKKKDGTSGKLVLTADNAQNWVGIVVEAESDDLQEVTPDSGEFTDEKLYGSLHNQGHEKFAEIGYHEYTSDKNPMGVMATNHGSPRDPCFWLWHRHIDDFRQLIAEKFTHNLDEFKPDAEITALAILPTDSKSTTPSGGIATFLGPPYLELNEANAKIDHENYQWSITIQSTQNPPPTTEKPQLFTVRLFITPGAMIQDQRAWIEMDKFTYSLTKVEETIIRKDLQSSVAKKVPKYEGEILSSRCQCGWPQNMMLPIGKPGGMDYVAFAMLTDDKLDKDDATQSVSFCGAKNDKYPDPRGMGYPFDKIWKSRRDDPNVSVRDVIKKLSHIKLYDFKIYRYTKRYQGRIKTKPSSDITWDNTIKDFFTPRDVECMKANSNIDLSSHSSVSVHAGMIYSVVEDGSMPKGGPCWSDEKVDTFLQWKNADCP